MSDIILTISLLVSGRKDTTIKCLDSLKPLLDRLPSELILVDTGCPEELRQQLDAYTDQVIPFSWCDDFAKARNAGLEKAQGEWFLYLDDDEWFEDVSPIVEFFRSGEYHEYEQAVYKARNYDDLQGKSYSEDWVSRMIHLKPETHFEGKVHEALVPTPGKCKRLDAFVHHFGYAFPDEESRRAHFNRNVAILKKLEEEEPENMRWPLQMLQECASVKDGKLLYEEASHGLQMVEEADSSFVNRCRGAFYSGELCGLGFMKQYDRLEAAANAFLQDKRNGNEVVCSICYYAVRYLEEGECWEKIPEYCRLYCDSYGKLKDEHLDEQERTILESIILVKDAISQDVCERMVLFWAKALIRLGREKDFPEEKGKEIDGAFCRFIDGNGEFLEIPEEIWELGENGILPMEERLLELPLSQWMAQVIVLDNKADLNLWEKIRDHLQKIQTTEDIRYHYFSMHASNMLLGAASEEESYEQLCGRLSYYVTSNLTYAHEVYTDEAFQGGMELLPPYCRGAVWGQECLKCENNDWSGQLEFLKKAAEAYTGMGGFVKILARKIGQEQEKQSKEAEAARQQLQMMAKQVKAQVYQFMEQGLYTEAYDIVCQLLGMLPEDKELKKLKEKLIKKFS